MPCHTLIPTTPHKEQGPHMHTLIIIVITIIIIVIFINHPQR